MLPTFIDKEIVPHRPGVYIYKGESGETLYVGKAIDLYNRVSSYFSKNITDSKTESLVKNIRSLETIEVNSEIEALILEANLIKKYLPPYNVRLTDDKDYLYIKVTDEPYPKILTARKSELSGSKAYFGPFPSSRTVKNTLKKLRRVFPWCQQPPKQGLGGSRKPCFYYYLNQCIGPCAGDIDRKEYLKVINRFIKFMDGRYQDIEASLEKEMKESSLRLDFEEANRIKKTLEGIKYLLQPNSAQVYLENPNFIEDQNKQSLESLKKDLKLAKTPERIECFDISNLGGKLAVGSLVVLENGELSKKWYRKFRIRGINKPNDVGMMEEVIQRRVKHQEWPKPDLVLVDGGRGQVRAAYKIIREKGWDVPVLGLAKRLEWLYTPLNLILKLDKASPSLRALQKIRDEAHRFAINYHKKIRGRVGSVV